MTLRETFLKEITATPLSAGPLSAAPVTEADLVGLPEPAQRYLRFMGVVGRPRDWSLRARFTGRFRTQPGQAWMSCEAWQYTVQPATARLFYMQLRVVGLVPAVGRDTYINGHGRLRVRLFDLLTVEDEDGPELDRGELVTYLNDAVLFAPSFLLCPQVAWRAVDERSFEISLADHGQVVTACVVVDEQGAPREFSTNDRYYLDPHAPDAVRARWSTPVAGWQVVDGRRLPTRAQAIWHLPAGDFAYADFQVDPAQVAFNVRADG